MKTRKAILVMLHLCCVILITFLVMLLSSCASLPLTSAVWDDDTDELKSLLVEGADPNAKYGRIANEQRGHEPLFQAKKRHKKSAFKCRKMS